MFGRSRDGYVSEMVMVTCQNADVLTQTVGGVKQAVRGQWPYVAGSAVVSKSGLSAAGKFVAFRGQ